MMNAQAKFSSGISRHRCTNFSGVIPAVAGKEFGLYVKIRIAGYRVGARENGRSAALAHVNPFMSELSATVLQRNLKYFTNNSEIKLMIKTITAILQIVKLKEKEVKWHLLQKSGKKS